MKSCFLFDIDGTLTDSDHYHFIAFNNMLEPHDVRLTRDEFTERVSGRSNSVILADLLPHLDVDQHNEMADQKEAAFRKMATTLHPLPGLLALLDWADAHHVPCGAVTNAPRANANHMLDALGIKHRFKVIVLAEELAHQKPHPLPYLTGLKLLGCDAAASVGFEDSVSGLNAAVGAGLTTIGILTSMQADAVLETGAHLAAADYEDPALLALVKETCKRG
eukprot:gene6232-6300_t